jgi:hypothetical protein
VVAARHTLQERFRALLGRSRAVPPPAHTHRLELPPERLPGESVPTGRCACGAIGIAVRDLAGREWSWLRVVAPDLEDRVAWLAPGEYAAALQQTAAAGADDAEPGAPLDLHQR